jgi:hypothetical protein
LNLFSDEEFNERYMEAARSLDDEPFSLTVEHDHKRSDKTRISSLGHCSLQQWASIVDIPTTDPRDPGSYWTTTLGTHVQAIQSEILKRMGYTVTDEEKTVDLTGEGLIIGHIDGVLSGLDIGDRKFIWDAKGKGIYQMFGTKESFGIANDGLPLADPGINMQLQSYIEAEKADGGIVLASPFDMSANKTTAAIKKQPHKMVYRVILEPDPEAVKLAISRGKLMTAAVKTNMQPVREFNPTKDKFPCGYCEVKSWCMVYGDSGQITLPPIPDDWKTRTSAPELIQE